MYVALHNLLHDRLRFALNVLGVALAVMLVLFLLGLEQGLRLQITAYLRQAPGSIVVTQAGVESFSGGSSLLPPGLEEDLRRVPGVAKVVPVLTQTAIFDLHDKKIFAFLIGYDPALGGGPWRIGEGREPRERGEVVFDRVLARLHGVRVGDTVEVQGQKFPVVGLSEGTASWMSALVFVRKADLESYLLTPGLSSLALVTPAPGVAPEALRARLKGLPGVEVWLKSDLIESDLRLYRAFFKPVRLMSLIAFLVGTLVVGLVIYSATVERQREYGVLKALGARNARLYGLVLAQALIVAALGSLSGILLGFAAARLVLALRPQILVALEPGVVGLTLLTGLFMALLAAWLPARLVAGLAPAEVFRR